MPRDDSSPEQLWETVRARTRNEAAANGPASDHANGSAPNIDALLVDALYHVLRESPEAIDGAEARGRLREAIVATASAPPVISLPERRRAWSISGRRQTLLAAALILITVAAIGYLLSCFWPALCGTPSTPLVTPSLPNKLHERLPKTGPAGTTANPLGGALRLLPISAGSVSGSETCH